MMIRVILLLCCFLFYASVDNAQAQQKPPMTKQQEKQLKKQWKKKAKFYKKNPLALMENQNAFQEQIKNLTDKLNACEKDKYNLQQEIKKLENTIKLKNFTIDSLKNEYSKLQTAYEATKVQATKDIVPGLVFRVQVGAFEKFDLSKYLSETSNDFWGETADDLNKYCMGKFRDYNMAEAFRADMQKLGIKDAWVVAYQDGKRITVTEAKLSLQEQGYKFDPGNEPKAGAKGDKAPPKGEKEPKGPKGDKTPASPSDY